jgi:hypothetical protein
MIGAILLLLPRLSCLFPLFFSGRPLYFFQRFDLARSVTLIIASRLELVRG